MVGQIAPKNLFDLRPDLRAMSLLFRLKEKNAHTIFGAIADELKKDGVELVEATPWLKPIMPQAGFPTRPGIVGGTTRGCGIWFSHRPGGIRLEIGQTVVVKKARCWRSKG